MSDVQGRVGESYDEVQCIMSNGHMGPPVNKQTDMSENITFPQLCWRAVIKSKTSYLSRYPTVIEAVIWKTLLPGSTKLSQI